MSKNTKTEKNTIELKENPKGLVGSENMNFMNVLFNELIDNMWLPKETTEENRKIKMDAAMETLRQIAPQNGLEGMLAVQMASTHQAAMECLRRAALPNQTFESRDMSLKHGEKLLRLYMDQLKALSKHRGQGDQKMVIEHVNVEPGGQAFVGQVKNKSQHKNET